MNALSCAAVSMSLPRRRAATILLVPTSMPYGLALTRSSMRSSASCATFQRWSLRSLMALLLLSCRAALGPGRGRWALCDVLFVAGLFGDPVVVQLVLLAAEDFHRPALLLGLVVQSLFRFVHAGPGRPHHAAQELVV